MRYNILFFVFILACNQNTKTLPACSGQQEEVVFVMDDSLWDGPLKALISNVFGEEILGINQSERLFRIIQVNHHEFKSILKTHTNIIIISNKTSSFEQKNKWANGQYVAKISWDGDSQKFLNILYKLRSKFVFKELEFIRKSFLNKSQKKAENDRKKNFGVDGVIPSKYKVLVNNQNLFWANFNPARIDEIKNIFTFSFDSDSLFHPEEVLRRTDSLFAKYLKGSREGTYVRIEPKYEPQYSKNTYRGLWRLENGFMGGPFIIKSYVSGNKIIVNAGLVFAPQNRKRKYIKEFEAIL